MPKLQPARLAFSLLFPLALAAACTSTKLVSTWQDPRYAGGAFQKLMVIGLGASPGGRAEFENAMVDALTAQGVIAVASVGYFADASQMTRDAVRGWVMRDGFQGVLVTRLEDVKQSVVVTPPQYQDLYGYWGYYGTVMTPGYVDETTKFIISTDLFDARTGGVVYTAESNSFNPSSRGKLIKELTKLLVDDLTKRGLLPPKLPPGAPPYPDTVPPSR